MNDKRQMVKVEHSDLTEHEKALIDATSGEEPEEKHDQQSKIEFLTLLVERIVLKLLR